MRSCSGLLFLASLFSLASALHAQQAPPRASRQKPKLETQHVTVTPAPDYSHEDEIIEKMVNDTTFHPDGTAESTTTSVIHVQTDAAVRSEGVFRFGYAAGEFNCDIVYLRVRKSDGRVIETSPADAQDSASQVTREAPMYSDIRVKELPVKGLAPGDTLEVQISEKLVHPLQANQFWSQWNFPTGVVVLSYDLNVRVPASSNANIYSPNAAPVKKAENGQLLYSWHTSQLEPTRTSEETKKEKAARTAANARKKQTEMPDVSVSSYQSWEQIGDFYQKLQSDRLTVTPELKAKADELVKGAATDEARIAALYTYVSLNLRYIGVNLGIGRMQPHSAETVFENQYGDCKDKHTLLATLLKAEGFAANAVLIGSEHELEASFPTPSQFDHVITAVELNGKIIWLDSTPETAPFQFLLSPLRNRQGLMVPATGTPKLVRTPGHPPFPLFSEWTTDGSLNDTGEYNGRFYIRMRDDTEVYLRSGYRATGSAQQDQLTQRILAAYRFGGDASRIQVTPPEKLDVPLEIRLDYTRSKFGDWPNHKIYPMLPIWGFVFDSDSERPVTEFGGGGSGTNTFISRMTLPDGWTAQLPRPTNFSSHFVEYSNTYTMDKNTLVTTRKIQMKTDFLQPDDWDQYLKWKDLVDNDEDRLVKLLAPGEKAEAESASTPEAARLVQLGYEAVKQRDFDGAQKNFQDALKLNAKEPFGHGGLAAVAAQRRDFDLYAREIALELDVNPDYAGNVPQEAWYLVSQGHEDLALTVVQAASRAQPDNATLAATLGLFQTRSGKYTDAMQTLEKAVKMPGTGTREQMWLADAYIKAGNPQKAESALQHVFTTSNDAMQLNDAAYFASVGKVLLPEAEAAARKSLDLLTTDLAKAQIAKVTPEDVAHVVQLSNIWDTLGWVLFEEGKVDAAEPYVRASWTLEQAPTVGLHLGTILEQEQKPKDALLVYSLAAASHDRNEPEDNKAIQARITALRGRVKLDSKNNYEEMLQEMRGAKIPNRSTTEFASDPFVVRISAAGVDEVRVDSGSPHPVKDAEQLLRQAKFQQTFPPDSRVTILRRGIVACSAYGKACTAQLMPAGSSQPD